MKDSMTLPALVTNIQKAHTPAPHVRMIQFISDVKGWIKTFLNKVKDHVCPHTYRFFERNDQVRIKYKNWASDQTWLLESPGQCILSSTRREIPPLDRPGTKKLLPIKDLEECVKKCKRLTHEDRQWWSSLILAEKAFRAKWEAASAKFLSEDKRAEWHLNKLKRHRPIKEATTADPDQQQREETLNDLLRKAHHFPQVSQ